MKMIRCNREKLTIVRELALAIWPSTYGEILAEAQVFYMLDTFYSFANLEKQMDMGQVFELLLEDTNAVGFVCYEINCNATGFLKIHKIYLLPEVQGKGYGKFMIDEMVTIAKSNNQKGIFLNVNKYNKAQSFYSKLGFAIIREEVIDIGHNYIMDDYVMELFF